MTVDKNIDCCGYFN